MAELLELVPQDSVHVVTAGPLPVVNMSPIRVTFNRKPCAAHSIQLRVKSTVKGTLMKSAISSIRDTSKYFRKSPTGASYLAEVQARMGKKCLRLRLDVAAR